MRSRAAVDAMPSVGSAPEESELHKIIIVDNYDSFTYNLVQYVGDCGAEYIVIPNDLKTVEEIKAYKPSAILVSPGPGCPEESGISLDVISLGMELGIPVFGVCMGHQCIGQFFGGDVIRHPSGVMHGKMSLVSHTGEGVLEGLPNPFRAARYHSLVIDKENCPDDLEVTAWCEDGTIMAVRHKKYPNIQGVQFHPESVLTEDGKRIVRNFVRSI
jgi:anthranilate synthase component 2